MFFPEPVEGPIELEQYAGAKKAKLPFKSFANRMESNGLVLHDAVHTIHQYADYFESMYSSMRVVSATVMPPQGFRHIKKANDDYRGYEFRVLAMELAI